MKIVIEGNQQKVKRKFDKKNFGFFFPGKGKQWTRKLVILKADFQQVGAGRRTCHAHQMKALIKEINLMCVTLLGNGRKPFKIGLE